MSQAKMIIVLLVLSLVDAAEDPLKFVGVFIRHGARTPLGHIKELDDRCSWPNGRGELTPSGQRQHYLLGRLLRTKYIENEKLLSETYDSSQIFFRSTFVHRTISSGQSFAMGLYPQGLPLLNEKQMEKEAIWKPPMKSSLPEDVVKGLNNSGLPFNVHSIPVTNFLPKNDRLILFDSCPIYTQYRRDYYKSQKFKETYEKFKPDVDEACNLLKVNCSGVSGQNIFYLVDYFVAGEFDGQIPELSHKPELVKRLATLYTNILLDEVSMEPIMSNIAMHGFAETFDNHINNVTEGKTSMKMAVYATHDSTLLAFLIAMGVDKKLYDIMPFASNLIIELRQSNDGKYYVNYLYNGEKIFNFTKDEFLNKIKELGKLDKEWNEVCAIPKVTLVSQGKSSSSHLLIAGVFIILGIIGLLGICIYKKPTKNQDPLMNI